MRYRILLLLWVCLPANAAGYSLLKLDTATVLPPQHIETNAGFSAGDGHWAVSAMGRIGIVDSVDIALRLGPVLQDEAFGVEAGFGGRYALLTLSDTSHLVDIEAGTDLSLSFSGPTFVTGLDPKVIVSREWEFAKKKSAFAALSVGAAMSVFDRNGDGDETRAGLLVAVNGGADLTEALRFMAEFAWRDGLKRVGGSVGYRF